MKPNCGGPAKPYTTATAAAAAAQKQKTGIICMQIRPEHRQREKRTFFTQARNERQSGESIRVSEGREKNCTKKVKSRLALASRCRAGERNGLPYWHQQHRKLLLEMLIKMAFDLKDNSKKKSSPLSCE